MSFGYIKMFFFLSLAIVFLFILLMCYYLKNKITVVEKRVGSQMEVLGKLIRELKFHAFYGGKEDPVENGGPKTQQQLETVLEEEEKSDSESETESETSETEDGDDTVNEDDDVSDREYDEGEDEPLLDIDETVKITTDEVLHFEKIANDNAPVVNVATETVEEDVEKHIVLESEPIAEPKDVLEEDTTEEIAETSVSPEWTSQPVAEDYRKMSLAQLKQVAHNVFHLSTTQIAKMKKEELLKWVLAAATTKQTASE